MVRGMEPLFGFTIFTVVAFIVSIIAGKRAVRELDLFVFWLCVLSLYGKRPLSANIVVVIYPPTLMER